MDPSNAPHIGGNTWAGGTGGRDTAGLGGKGGPYRLDAGHDVFQLSDQEKQAVPEEVHVCMYVRIYVKYVRIVYVCLCVCPFVP